MRRYSLSAAMLLALIAGPLSGCAHTGSGGYASSRSSKIEAQYDLARLAESENELEKSREMYESILKKDPSNAMVVHRLGIVNARQAKFEDAKQYLNQAHKMKPSDPEILNDLGYACYISGDYNGAEDALELALKVDSQNRRATNNLALVMGSTGRFDESYQLFRRVNKDAEAHANVAYLYAQNGEGKKALEHYSRALSLDPDMKNAGNAMIEMAQVQQKLERDRNQERTQLAARQPTPAADVRQVSDAKPSMPQLNDVIADVRSAEAQPVVTQPELVARPAVVAQPEVVSQQPAIVVEPAPQRQAAEVPEATVEVADDQEAKDAFLFETETEPKITPSARPQAPVAVAEQASPVAIGNDYVAMCPQAKGEVAELLASMNSQDVGQVKAALHKLGELAGTAAPALPAIQTSLTHADPYVRIHSALALWRIQQNTADTVPAFVEGLQNTDAGVRSFAATALAMGPRDITLVTPLTAALSDANPYVRLHAAETLYQYPEQQATASQVLITHLNDKEANVRWLATFILGELLPKSEVAVQALTQALQDGDNRIRAGAAFALGGLGEEAVPALPELKKLTTDSQPDVRKAAEEAVRDIEHSSAQANAE